MVNSRGNSNNNNNNNDVRDAGNNNSIANDNDDRYRETEALLQQELQNSLRCFLLHVLFRFDESQCFVTWSNKTFSSITHVVFVDYVLLYV